ncbi:phosphatase and actin regulator 3-like isoform X1 [Scleropages formosus]|uniref:Phosphatase and actin regulator n=1 Tax=Scleropages formosus TaxID=113540 RepID=A0A8C9S2P9_SCLFO|nr:phosphatase and actin regulator 3-like isoform X1 [Scleropages formosus]
MATSDGVEHCARQRGRSQSDPSILTESRVHLTHDMEVREQQRGLHSGRLVTGVHTPPIARNSKLASLGRIFKPWKWRKKKADKLKQSSTALERKAAARQSRGELSRKEQAEATEPGVAPVCGQGSTEPGPPALGSSGMGEREVCAVAPSGALEDMGSDRDSPSAGRDTTDGCKVVRKHNLGEEEEDEEEEATLDGDAPEGIRRNQEGRDKGRGDVDLGGSDSPAKLAVLPRCGSVEESAKLSPSSLQRTPKDAPNLRGQGSTPTGSPHQAKRHSPLPPSCIIEELHRALATKHRQDSFHAREVRSSPKRWSEGRHCSVEREEPGVDSEENKENLRQDGYGPRDQDSWNDSVTSGTLPRRMKKELLAVKLRNRPSKQELEERNIFPTRSDQERQEIRQQIETKLAKRLSQRPAVEELEGRNILKQRNDQTEQEERREIKQRLNRKLNQRPTVDELRDRKILIRFSDYVEVAKAQDYDRRADKPWTRLSAADKAAIRKELNEFKSNEMEVHASSKHLTRFHRP